MFFDILIYTASLLFAMLAIGFCIFSHELGHFLAARWRGLDAAKVKAAVARATGNA